MRPILDEVFERQRVKSNEVADQESKQPQSQTSTPAQTGQGESTSQMEEAKREQKKQEKEGVKLAARSFECLGQLWPKPDPAKPSSSAQVATQAQHIEWVISMLSLGLIGTDWEIRVAAFGCLAQ